MTSLIRPPRREWRLVPIAAALAASLAFLSAPGSARESPRGAFTDPAAIDDAVADFTGAAIGEVGGARAGADRRLRLAACAQPLETSWHGNGRATVAVECAGPQSWRIFVSVLAAPRAAPRAPLVTRGDPVTVAVRGRGFTVQQSGEAMESGSAGEWIAIRTARGAEPIRARIERPGLAVIPLD